MKRKKTSFTMTAILLVVVQWASLAFAEEVDLDRRINKRGEDVNSTYLKTVGKCYISTADIGGHYYFCYNLELFNRSKKYKHQIASLFSPDDGESKTITLDTHTNFESYTAKPKCFGPANINNPARAIVYRDECLASVQSSLRLLEISNDPSIRRETNRQGRR